MPSAERVFFEHHEREKEELRQQLTSAQAEIAARDDRIAELSGLEVSSRSLIKHNEKVQAKEREWRARVRELEAALMDIRSAANALYAETNEAGLFFLPNDLHKYAGPIGIIDRVTDAALAAAATTEPAPDAREAVIELGCKPAPLSEARGGEFDLNEVSIIVRLVNDYMRDNDIVYGKSDVHTQLIHKLARMKQHALDEAAAAAPSDEGAHE